MSAPSDGTFNSTTNIRDLIYKELYEERNKAARAAKREQLKKEKEEEERQEKVSLIISFVINCLSSSIMKYK